MELKDFPFIFVKRLYLCGMLMSFLSDEGKAYACFIWETKRFSVHVGRKIAVVQCVCTCAICSWVFKVITEKNMIVRYVSKYVSKLRSCGYVILVRLKP